MYGPIAGGLFGACQEIWPKSLEDDGLCSCGALKAPGDWLCFECRKSLDEHNKEIAAEIQMQDHILFPYEDEEEIGGE